MENNYEITVSEIIALLKSHWKMIGIAMLLFMLICGGYRLMTSEPSQTTLDPNYDENMKIFQQFQSAQKDVPYSLKNEWEGVYNDRVNNPVYTVNPYNCEYEQIVLSFEEVAKDHDSIVANWVAKADNQVLFGSHSEDLSDYKNTIIMVGQKVSGETGETAVKVLAIKDFDSKGAAKYLVQHFKKCAAEDNAVIESISTASIKGYNEELNNYLKRNKDDLITIYSALETNTGLERYITDPGITQENQSNRIASIIKYCLMGLIVGFVVGAVLVILNAIRKREIISSNQIEKTFKLELLGDFSSGSDDSLDVLNANMDIMTGEKSTIMVIADDGIKGLDEMVSRWSENSDRTFLVCTDIFNDFNMIEALRMSDGIVLGIKPGFSKLEQTRRVMTRASKLNQTVLGYVLL